MSKTDVVVRLAKAKHEAARQRVFAVLQDWPDGQPLTFRAVGQRASVSKTFLYAPQQADLADQIRQRRVALTPQAAPPLRLETGKSTAAKDAQIARLQERVRDQERELARLRAENAQLYGRLAEGS